MKKILAIILTLSFMTTSAFAADVVVNGKNIDNALLVDGTVYVPLRSVGETMGAQVSWDDSTKTAYVNSGEIIPEIIKGASDYVVGIIGHYVSESAEGVGYGSGFIISEDGKIVTNAHVVSGLKQLMVVLNDGSTHAAKVVGIDNEADVALIKIEKKGLKCAKFADSNQVQVGQTAIAIGTPISFSLRNSATSGIVSGINRSSDNSYRLIQSDATLNKGNSGGPLLNLKGEVIGMGTQGIVGVGVTGLFFSVTSNTINYVLNHFEKYGKVRRPNLGVELSEGWLAEYDLPSDEGLVIKEIYNNSPASKSGLLEDDAIMGIGDVKFNTIVDYNEAMKNYLPGDTIPFKVRRGNSVFTLNVQMG